jgi:hypothetical protein
VNGNVGEIDRMVTQLRDVRVDGETYRSLKITFDAAVPVQRDHSVGLIYEPRVDASDDVVFASDSEPRLFGRRGELAPSPRDGRREIP